LGETAGGFKASSSIPFKASANLDWFPEAFFLAEKQVLT